MITTKTKYIKHVSICLLAALLVLPVACTDHFEALNTPDDELVAENLDASLLGQAFAQSQYEAMTGSFQTCQNLFSDIYAQYFATIVNYFDSDQYVEVGAWTNGCWNTFYSSTAPQIHFVEQFSAEHELPVANAIAKVWKVHSYQRITDYWGPIIYSEFGNGETSVSYDSQEEIYMDFFKTLDEAVAVLQQNTGGNAFSSNDLIYGGNVDQWLTFANSLRLRMAIRIRYVMSTLAQEEAEKAVAAGVMLDNSDNAMMMTTQNSKSPYGSITDWGEFRMSAAMESALEGYEDPRAENYFSPAADGDGDGDGSPYEGVRNGLPPTEKVPELKTSKSEMASKWFSASRGGSNPPVKVMQAAEVYFLRAEGALAGWNMGGTAQDLYEEGIRMSMQLTGESDANINAYINSNNTPVAPGDQWNSPPLSNIPVAYQSGADIETQLEQIITQKWLALYPNGWEAWAEYRRTGYPTLYPIIESENPDVSENEIFRRMTFVEDEYTNNTEAVEAALQLSEIANGGGDTNSNRVWWDAKPN